ncbi:uncharacterized protein BYT42DRAFT_597823 [Radiomyces spectabilis]|uniref:uncharacterized protein n=1 Tax=Radiomyces spectabilis TaxID=64574 RepID=UPI0022208D32|nr:uncharacterized protein BYT42DRAFT_597823 [Radiomyces spectabilis]KAI8384721.1 hypothetical protein BYT42DRAFT_597823 [Radiomyces spectabilis]
MASKWAVDYATLGPETVPKYKIANPTGFDANALQSSKSAAKSSRQNVGQDDHNEVALKVKRAWDVAMSPAKNIPMNAIMIYMTGNGVQIFSVMITAMLFIQPVKAIMSLKQTFERFETPGAAARAQPGADLLLPKLTFIAIHVLTMLLGVYKINAMGLLPTTTSDWLAFLPPKHVLEYSAL